MREKNTDTKEKSTKGERERDRKLLSCRSSWRLGMGTGKQEISTRIRQDFSALNVSYPALEAAWARKAG